MLGLVADDALFCFAYYEKGWVCVKVSGFLCVVFLSKIF